MEHLLSPRNRHRLERFFAVPNLLVALDFDGTLVPLTSDPESVYLSKGMEGVLNRLAKKFPLAIITGRSLKDIRRRIGSVPFTSVIGNHGIEAANVSKRDLEAWRQAVAQWSTE